MSHIEDKALKIPKTKTNPKGAGRPTVMTPRVLAKLEECFSKGYNEFEAYNTARISKDAFYDYKNKHPEFTEKIAWLRNNPNIKAKEIVNDKLNEGDINTAKWQLERRAKDEYSTRNETTGKDGKDLVPDSILRDDINPEEKKAYIQSFQCQKN